MPQVVSGDDVDEIARHVEFEVRTLHHAHDVLRRQADGLQWSGHARHTYGQRLGAQLHNLLTAADQLSDVATRLRTTASEARDERRRLDRLEQDVMDKLRASHDPVGFLAKRGLTELPPRWDTAWTDVHHRVFASG